MTYDPIDTNEADSTADGNMSGMDEIDVVDVITDNINNTDITVSAVTVNGQQLPIGGSITLSASDIGAVDSADFPDIKIDGNTVDSNDTLDFET